MSNFNSDDEWDDAWWAREQIYEALQSKVIEGLQRIWTVQDMGIVTRKQFYAKYYEIYFDPKVTPEEKKEQFEKLLRTLTSVERQEHDKIRVNLDDLLKTATSLINSEDYSQSPEEKVKLFELYRSLNVMYLSDAFGKRESSFKRLKRHPLIGGPGYQVNAVLHGADGCSCPNCPYSRIPGELPQYGIGSACFAMSKFDQYHKKRPGDILYEEPDDE